MPPLRTAASTAALRRTTHLLVFGCGRCSVSRVPPTDSPGRVFMGRRRAAPGTALHRQDPPETELAGKTAACSRAPCFMAPVLFYGPGFGNGAIPVYLTIFSRSRTYCHQLFLRV